MNFAPMVRAFPTTAQANRIHEMFDQAVAEHPRQADLLRGMERCIVQQPDDTGRGLPVPVEPLVEGIIAGVLKQGPIKRRKMRKMLRQI